MTTKYLQLTEHLKKVITANLKNGIFKLPTEQELCDEYQLSRQTVRTALALLQEEGLITKKQGSGAYATGLLLSAIENQIAILLTSDNEYLYPSLLTHLQSPIAKEGYTVSVYSTHGQISTEYEILCSLFAHPLRGLIVECAASALPTPCLELYTKLSAQGTSIVFLHSFYPTLSPALYVKDDSINGGYQLARHLINKNHTLIAGIFQIDTIQGQERYLGYAKAMQEEGLSFSDEHILWFTKDQLYALRKKQDTSFLLDFIQKKLTPCTAVICYNDEIAYWLIKELSYKKLQVPEDISIVSFDNSYLCTLSTPTLTSLTHDHNAISDAAVSLLFQKIHGSPCTPVILPWRLVERESVLPRF